MKTQKNGSDATFPSGRTVAEIPNMTQVTMTPEAIQAIVTQAVAAALQTPAVTETKRQERNSKRSLKFKPAPKTHDYTAEWGEFPPGSGRQVLTVYRDGYPVKGFSKENWKLVLAAVLPELE